MWMDGSFVDKNMEGRCEKMEGEEAKSFVARLTAGEESVSD